MAFSSVRNDYEHLDRAALVALLVQRDDTILVQQQELMEAAGQIKNIQRILNLRNKKIFGSTSEKSARTRTAEDIEYEEVKTNEGKGKQQNDPDGSTVSGDIALKKSSFTGQVAGNKRAYKNGHPGRNPLPAHLRREVRHFYPEGYTPDWKRELPPEITERLALKIEYYAEVDVRHKYAREGGIVIAPCPLEDPFYKYKATAGLVSHMLALRFGLHVPYYRFSQLLPGCNLSYATFINWAARAFEVLSPLKAVLAQEVLKDARLVCMDETPFKLLDAPSKVLDFKAKIKAQEAAMEALHPTVKGNKEPQDIPMPLMEEDGTMEEELATGSSKKKIVLKGQMWTLLNPATGLVMFEYCPSRATINALLMLSGYKGLLMADAYTAYRRLARLSPKTIVLLSCWAHARRRVLESQDPKYTDPVVTEISRRIGALYRIEKEIKGLSPAKKKKIRKRSRKLLRSLKAYMEVVIENYAPKEAVRVAIQYCLNHWTALSAYPHHKYAIVDNNLTERAIRPITVARKNILFLGSVDHAPGAALLYSLTQCCKLQKIDPQAWLLDVMTRIEQYPKDRLADLLPHKWKMKPSDAGTILTPLS